MIAVAIDFPNSPTLYQDFTVGSRTWTWNGEKWMIGLNPSTTVLDDLADVNAPSPSNGEFLRYDGSEWVSLGAGTSSLATAWWMGN